MQKLIHQVSVGGVKVNTVKSRIHRTFCRFTVILNDDSDLFDAQGTLGRRLNPTSWN
nr:hypothetical protein [Edaphobacter lichenicola]